MIGKVATSGIDIGTIVADTYRVTRMLGRGGMGAVWEAEHLRLPGKKVAIKVLHADVAMDQDSVARFRREAEIASRLGHPNIVGVHDFNTLPGGKPYLVLDYLEGESLDARLARGRLQLSEVLEIVRQVGSALRAAHREDVIHRDLKPQNVFMAAAGPDGDEVAVVLDFGISKIRGSQTVKTQDSTILGTPQYMAPEQAVGNHAAVDATTDVFALGAMIYEMLAGRPAFVGQTIPEVVFKVVYEEPTPITDLVSELPDSVVHAVHRALSKQQADRPPTIEAFVQDLTGQPLATARRRRASLVPGGSGVSPTNGGGAPGSPGAAPADVKDSSPDAMAATVGSGSLDPIIPIIGTADTIDSGKMAPQLSALAAQRETTSPTTPGAKPGRMNAPPTTAPRRHGRSALFLILAMVVGAGIAAGVAWQLGLFDRTEVASNAGPEPGDPPAPIPTGDPPARITERQPAATPPDAGTAVTLDAAIETTTETTRQRARPDETRRQRPDESSKKPDVPSAANDHLERANRALNDGDLRGALRFANRALRDGAGSSARAIKARVYCVQQDLGNAQANYRGLSGGAKRAVARYCARHGIEFE